MRNVNVSNFRKNLFEYVNQAIDYNDVINVNTKSGNVIVMSEEDYRGILETLYLQSIPGVADSITEGMKEEGKTFDWRSELK